MGYVTIPQQGESAMATATATPTLERASDYISDTANGRSGGIDKEEAYTYWRSAWRGQPVSVTMSADRYRVSSGDLTAWRIIAREVRLIDENGAKFQTLTSEIARRRLQEAIEPLVHDWLASDAYTEAEANAYAHLIWRSLADGSRYSNDGPRQLEQYGDKLAISAYNVLRRTNDARAKYLEALETASQVIDV
jgi:hypothetical protein